MANTSQWWGQSAANIVASRWVPTQMGVALLSTSFVPNIDSQQRFADISANEITGTGYTAGGQQIAGRTTSYDAAANEYNLLGSDLIWGPGASFTARYGAVYEMTTTDKWLWALLDFGGPAVVTSGNFQIDWVGAVLSIQIGPPV